MMDMGTVRTKVTSKVTYSIRLAFGIAPNDVRHSARSTSFSPFGIPPFGILSRSRTNYGVGQLDQTIPHYSDRLCSDRCYSDSPQSGRTINLNE